MFSNFFIDGNAVLSDFLRQLSLHRLIQVHYVKHKEGGDILFQKKYSRVICRFAEKVGISLDDALTFFYSSDIYTLVSEGVSDMHCMSDEYLAEDLAIEYRERISRF